MTLDEIDYPVIVNAILNTWEDWDEISDWAALNDIPIRISFNLLRFKEEAHAVLFRLTFSYEYVL